MKREEVLTILEDLLRMDDVLACMVAKRGLEGIFPKGIKIKNADLWRLIHQTTEQIFQLVDNFYDYGLERLYFELGDYTIIIAPVSRTFSLVVVIPSLANMGLLDVEIENTKRKIVKLSNKSQ
jgi:predicted regulator of Ras-like GTPase activity (Roadblock/LC7/MglB family)